MGLRCRFFSFGPAFFSQLQTSIHYGFHRSVPFAFGVFAGDAFIVFLMLTVLKNVDMYEILHNIYVASIAALVMVFMGIYTFRKTAAEEPKGDAIKFRVEDLPRRHYRLYSRICYQLRQSYDLDLLGVGYSALIWRI